MHRYKWVNSHRVTFDRSMNVLLQHVSCTDMCIGHVAYTLRHAQAHTGSRNNVSVSCWTSNVKVPLNEAHLCSSGTAHYVCFVSTQIEDWKSVSSPRKVGNAVTALQSSCCPNMESLFFKSCFIHCWRSPPSTWSAWMFHHKPVWARHSSARPIS